MSVVELKIFDRFVRLAPPKYLRGSWSVLHLLSVLGVAKEWWRSILGHRPTCFPMMGWVEFTEVFLKRFVQYSLREQCMDEFNRLEKVSLLVYEYEAHFHELSCYAMLDIPTELD
ncbi:hypothetical protein R3W88_033650 [Solanum pinnatisectum]|uniref:Retrotransposon gag domain-containing protein n=1 Tax=Solanum pinnatisectum TaxID=50273 RepID=A0AAV9K251_9SOLN|nr:hypothetical protein R3W88_033650 [Solanum pinnatisectum]